MKVDVAFTFNIHNANFQNSCFNQLNRNSGHLISFKKNIFLNMNTSKTQWKSKLIRFLIYIVVGFICALLYSQLKK